MLRRLGQTLQTEGVRTTFAESAFPAPFPEGLEFSSPARGTWNIVHTGLLIPEAHEIFVCARGCLRGVVLTAAEANALSRYSAIEICEENILDGSMEELMVEGVADVLKKLPYRPRAVLLYISCQHFFMAYDQGHVFAELRRRFPDIRFADCYMIPTLRKSGVTPDQKMRIQLYSLLEPGRQMSPRVLNHIGSNLPIHPSSELLPWLSANGITLRSLHDCKTFDDYLSLSESAANLYYEPLSAMAAKSLEGRLGQEAIYLPFVFDFEGLVRNYQMLAERFRVPLPDLTALSANADAALSHALSVIGKTPIAVDYTFTFRILSFTRMLLTHGFCVEQVYSDSFLPEEEEDFCWIREHFPNIEIWATNRPKMRFRRRDGGRLLETQGDMAAALAGGRDGAAALAGGRDDAAALAGGRDDAAALAGGRDGAILPSDGQEDCRILAIGQKAAYFTGTEHFVNVAESGGFYGFGGICEITRLMEEAFYEKKDPKDLIQRKGYGCESCIWA